MRRILGPGRPAARAARASTSRSTTAARARSSSGPSGSSSTTANASPSGSGPGRRRPDAWSSRRTPPTRRSACERAIETWPDDDSTRAVLARTNRELLPAVVVALELGIPFRAPRIELLLDSPRLDALLAPGPRPTHDRASRCCSTLGRAPGGDRPGIAGRMSSRPRSSAGPSATTTLEPFVAAIDDARARLAELRRDDAALTLATAHATKGLEFDHVVVVGMEAGRFPSGRTVAEADDPVRAYEEERRLAYVAWTRARRSLTLLYDPAVPSAVPARGLQPDGARRSAPGSDAPRG